MHDKQTQINNEIWLVFSLSISRCSVEDLILAILLSKTTCIFLVNVVWIFTVNNNGNFIVQSLFESSREMSYMCIMGLFVKAHWSVQVCIWLIWCGMLLEFQYPWTMRFFFYSYLYLLNQIASFLYEVFGAMCYFPLSFTSPLFFLFCYTLSLSCRRAVHQEHRSGVHCLSVGHFSSQHKP